MSATRPNLYEVLNSLVQMAREGEMSCRSQDAVAAIESLLDFYDTSIGQLPAPALVKHDGDQPISVALATTDTDLLCGLLDSGYVLAHASDARKAMDAMVGRAAAADDGAVEGTKKARRFL